MNEDLIKISEMSSLTGVCSQTLRNYETMGNIKADTKSKGGHRFYSKEQMYDILRYRNKEEIERYDGRRIILFIKDDLFSRILLLYIRYKYKDYKHLLVDIDKCNTENCINYVSSVGLVDYIYMYNSEYDCLRKVDLFTKRLGIKKVKVIEDEEEEFLEFCKSYHCFLLLDLLMTQLNNFISNDRRLYDLILGNLISCVNNTVSSSKFKLTYTFSNFKVVKGEIKEFNNIMSSTCFRFKFSIEDNILCFIYERNNKLMHIESKRIEEFLGHYMFNRTQCSLCNMYDNSNLMLLCLIH